MPEQVYISDLPQTSSGNNLDQFLISREGSDFNLNLVDLKGYTDLAQQVDFSFDEVTGQYLSGSVKSEKITISGLDTPQIITASGNNATISINEGEFVLQNYVSNGDTVQVKMDTSTVSLGQAVSYITIGNTTEAFTGTNGNFSRLWNPLDSIHQPFLDIYSDNTGNFLIGDYDVTGVSCEISPLTLMRTGTIYGDQRNYNGIPYSSGGYYEGFFDLNSTQGWYAFNEGPNGLDDDVPGIKNITGEFTLMTLIRPISAPSDRYAAFCGFADNSFTNTSSNFFYYTRNEALTSYSSKISRWFNQGSSASYGDVLNFDNEQYYVFTYSHDGTTGHYYINGEEVASPVYNIYPTGLPSYVYAGGVSYQAVTSNSNIYAMIGLTGHIEKDEIHKWEGYLTNRFNLQEKINLIDGHPYQDSAPQV